MRSSAPGWNRTSYLPLRRRLLYPVSYEGQAGDSVAREVDRDRAPAGARRRRRGRS
jgi:hypothetical protein